MSETEKITNYYSQLFTLNGSVIVTQSLIQKNNRNSNIFQIYSNYIVRHILDIYIWAQVRQKDTLSDTNPDI